MSKRHEGTVEGLVLQPWETPTVKVVGTVGDVLKGGGGKDSISPADPGEARKPKPPNPEK